MTDDTNKRKLYDALSADYSDLGSFEQFSAKVEDEGSRRKLYDAIKDEFEDIGDFDSFSKKLVGTPKPKHLTPEETYQLAQPGTSTYDYQGALPKVKQTARPQTMQTAPTAQPQRATQQQPAQTAQMPADTSTQDSLAGIQRLTEMRQSLMQQPDTLKQMEINRKRDTILAVVNNDDDALDRLRAESEAKAQAQAQKEQTREEVAGLGATIEEGMAEENRRLRSVRDGNTPLDKLADKDTPWWKKIGYSLYAAEHPTEFAKETDSPDMQMWRAAQHKLKEAERIIAEADHNAAEGTFGKWIEQSFAGGVARGFGQKVSDVSTWDFGISDIMDNAAFMKVLDKADKDEPLTQSEQALLDASTLEYLTNMYFGSEVGRGYKAGSVTAESLPFMLEMIINPAAGIGKGVQAKMVRYATKRFGEAAVKKGGTKHVAAKAVEIGGRLVGDIAGASTMSATTGAGRVTADAIDRMNTATLNGEKMEWGEAWRKAFAGTTIENYSEMFGAYFAPVLGAAGKGMTKAATSKLGNKVGLAKVHDFVQNVKASDVAKAVADFEEHAQWNGMIGEYAEEVAGGIMNALVVGDQTLDSDPETGVFNLSNNIDTFLGVALMGGFLSGVKTVGYRTPKYQARQAMRTADKEALHAFGDNAELWGDMRDVIDNGTVDEVNSKLEEVLNNPDYSAEQKAAALNYIQKATAYKGVLNGEQKRRMSGEVDEQQLAQEEAYDRGYDAGEEEQREIAVAAAAGGEDATEARAALDGVRQRIEDDATAEADTERSEMRKMQHKDGSLRRATLKELDDNGNNLEVFIVDGTVTMSADGTEVDRENSDHSVVVYDPATGKRRMIDPANDLGVLSLDAPVSAEEIEARIEQTRQQQVQQRIDAATGKVNIEVGQVVQVPGTEMQGIVVAISEDGEGLTVQTAEGEQVPVLRSDLQRMADESTMADYEQRRAEEAAAEQPDVEAVPFTEGTPATYEAGMEVDMYGDTGVMVRGTITGNRYRYKDWQLVEDENGPIVEYVDANGDEHHENVAYLDKKVAGYRMPQAVAFTENEATNTEQPTDAEGATFTIVHPEALETQAMEQTEEQPTATETVEEASVEAMPMVGEGEEMEPDFMSVSPERGHTYIYNEAGLSAEEADAFVANNRAASENALATIQKKAPKMGTSLAQYNKAKKEHEAKVNAAQAKVDYWNGVAATQRKAESDRMMSELEVRDAERKAREAEESARHAEALAQQQAEYEAKQQAESERRAVGIKNPMPVITEKWHGAAKLDGAKDEIVLPNGERLKGHYVLHEAGASSPSHDPHTWQQTEGFPMDEQGGSVNDRDYERDKDAQRETHRIASDYDQRALQTPVVVSQDGVVLSGNGRTMAGMLAAEAGSDGKYIDYLREYAGKYGFTTEQVSAMQHPRVSFVPDEAMPYNAVTFAKFNAQEMKSQNKTETAVKLGKTVSDEVLQRIVNAIRRYDTLGDYYADPNGGLAAVGELLRAGVITSAQLPQFVDGTSGNEKLSLSGREMLENILIGKAFESNPDAVRMLTAVPSMRQRVVQALGEISDNMALGEVWTLREQLTEAVKLCYEARQHGFKEGEAVSAYARQGVLPFELGENATAADFNNATVLMLADVLNDSRVTQLKRVFILYNDQARMSAAGQTDLFSNQPVKSREEILREVITTINHAKQKEIEAAQREAVERRKADSVQQNGDATPSNAAGGRGDSDILATSADGVRQIYKELGLSDEASDELLEKMEAVAEEKPQVPLTPENWREQFGDKGIVVTPLGEVKMGENQIAKLFEKGRGEQFGMIKPTLENPNVVIEVPSENAEGTQERSSSFLFVKTFTDSKGKKIYYFKSVTVKKDNLEVSISSHYDHKKRIKDALKNGKLLYRFDGGAQTEQRPADVSVTVSPEKTQGISDGKDTNISETGQKNVAEGGENGANRSDKPNEADTPKGSDTIQFSVGGGVTEAEDKAYLDAVERGDMEAAQRMVEEAAHRAGYTIKAYHGSPNKFFEFKTNKIGISNGTSDGRGFYFTTDRKQAEDFANADGQLVDAYLKIENPLSYDKKTITKAKLRKIVAEIDKQQYSATGEHYFLLNYGDYYTEGINSVINEVVESEYEYADNDVDLVNSMIASSGDFGLIMNAVKKVTGKSSFIAPKENGTIHYIVTNPKDIKLSDAVTRDNSGNVIPLSDRFNDQKGDIRFSVGDDATEATRTQEAAAEVAVEMLRNAGVEVVMDEAEMAEVLAAEEALRAQKMSSKDTGSPFQETDRSPVVPFNDDAKILQNLDTAKEKYEKGEKVQEVNGDALQFLRTAKGEVYGFVKNGKVYLDPKLLNPNTPIHEYTHLWDMALQKANPELWARGVELMKQTPLWQEVVNNPAYADIKDDENLVASEVHARLSGAKGAKLLEEMVREAANERGVDYIEKAERVSVIDRLRDWVREAWQWVKDTMMPWTSEEAQQVTLEEFVNMPIKDLVEGKRIAPSNSERTQYRFIGEQGAANADLAEERSIRIDNLNVARQMEEQGKDAKTIKLATGWERGADGKWRYEVSDFKLDSNALSRLRNEADTNLGRRNTFMFLLDVIGKDNEFFAEYPGLKELRLKIDGEDNIEIYGNYDYNDMQGHVITLSQNALSGIVERALRQYGEADRNLLRAKMGINPYTGEKIDSDTAAEMVSECESDMDNAKRNLQEAEERNNEMVRNIISHEIQHAIQGIEGFARGGSVALGERIAKQRSPLTETQQNLFDDISIFLEIEDQYDGYTLPEYIQSMASYNNRYGDMTVEILNMSDSELREEHRRLSEKGKPITAYQAYNNLSGEVEARNVQSRMDMTPEERRASLAIETEDVSRDDQLFLFGGDEDVLFRDGEEDGAQYRIGDSEKYAGKTLKEISDMQYAKAQELLDALKEAGFKDYYISRSITRFGVSTYVTDGYAKWRISDHGVGHYRGATEHHFYLGSDVKRMVSSYVDEIKNNIEIQKSKKLQQDALDEQWENAKGMYDGMVVKTVRRTYQDMEEFMSKHPNAVGIYQKPIGNNAYSYEYFVPENEGRPKFNSENYHPQYKPSYEYIENMVKDEDNELFHDGEEGYIDAVNEQFNEQLSDLTEENANNIAFNLGTPSEILLSAGVEDKPMKLYGNKVIKKMKKHGFSLSELRDLPRAVADPIAVFDNYQKEGNRSILTELRTEQGNFLVSLGIGKDADVDFNIVSSVFGKGENKIVDWITRGYATYINKKKAQKFLSHHSAPIAETAANFELNSAAKVRRNSELQENSGENISERESGEALREMEEGERGVIYTTYDEALKRARKAGYSAKQFDSYLRNREASMKRRIDETIAKLGLASKVEIRETAEGLEGRKARAKGWYEPQTGKIVIILDNHKSVDDVLATILHEGVGHYGLRALFGSAFDTFLDNVYEHADAEVRSKINALAAKHGYNFHTATEEYLAGLAEDMDFETAVRQGWWQQIKMWFFEMLGKLGLPMQGAWERISDSELRYILWRSYQNLANPGRYRSLDPIARAEDIAMQDQLGVYAERNGEVETKPDEGEWAFVSEGGVQYADIEAVNERFNEELEQQINGTLPKGHIYQLGTPSAILRSAGIPDLPIELSAARLQKKSEQDNHPFDIKNLANLPQALANPIAVFDSRTNENSKVILTELQQEGNNFVVVMRVRQSDNGLDVDVNDIRSLYPKDRIGGVVNWINNGLLRYADKQKLTDFITQSTNLIGGNEAGSVDFTTQSTNLIAGGKASDNLRISAPIAEAQSGQELNSVAKILRNFENPVISEKNISEEGEGVLFRDGEERDGAPEVSSKKTYEDMIKSSSYQFTEAMQDSMKSLEVITKSILGGGKGFRIEEVKGYENAYLAANAMNSENAAQLHAWQQDYYNPIVKAVSDLIGERRNFVHPEKYDMLYAELTDYMMAKHGLERNEVMAARDYERYKEEHPKGGKTLDDFRARDYAGLTALTGKKGVAAAEAEAQRMVEEYEVEHDTDALWEAVNAATKSSLRKLAESGILSAERFVEIRNMYRYYIPLQGFESKVAEDVYAYMGSDGTRGYGTPIKRAEGRTSKADDPIATICMNGEAAIRQGNRNLMKQHFLRFVESHPSDLVSVSDVWLRKNDVTGEWEQYFDAGLEEDDSADEVSRKVAAFEARMAALAESDPDHYKRGSDKPNVPYRVLKSNDMNQHQVRVMRGGKTVVLTINGNPRAAQALNGITNPDVFTEGLWGKAFNAGQAINRELSQLYTTLNPEFVLSNFLRDAVYTNSMVWVKEGKNYALKFNANFGKMNPATMAVLFTEWELGMLRKKVVDGTASYNERMFYDFMMNGGETGWTSLRDIERHKKDLHKAISRERNAAAKAGKALGGAFDIMNRSVENCARFAAFVTSREMGRGMERSIYDAKEISVNFNKKGAGDKFFTAKGQTAWGKIGAGLSGAGRAGFVFFNAGVQGLNNIMRAAGRNPIKFGSMAATLFGLGSLVPILAEVLVGGDDDDKDAYYNLPEYVRRSNLCFRWSKDMPWITIPLPIEYRALYGLGELATGVITGKERYSDEELAKQLVSQVSQVLPLDFMEGKGGFHAFIPSALKPLVEAKQNVSWTGLPIYRNNTYNQYEFSPEWTRAYPSANQQIVEATKWLSEATGGDDVVEGWLDLNPAAIEYILKGYLGGFFSFPDKVMKSIETASSEREFEWRNIPFASRVLKEGDERTEYRKMQNEYYKLAQGEYKKTEKRLKGYEKKKKSGDEDALEYAERLDFLHNSPEYGRYQIMKKYKEPMTKLNKLIQEADGEKKEALKEQYYSKMSAMLDEIHAYDEANQ